MILGHTNPSDPFTILQPTQRLPTLHFIFTKINFSQIDAIRNVIDVRDGLGAKGEDTCFGGVLDR